MENATLNRKFLDERGFGLPTAILLVAVLVPLGMFGLALARQEQRTNVRTGSRAVAFYAAETGIARALDNWTTLDVAESGESWLVHEGTLSGGASYRVEATKLDDANNVHGLFAIRSEGQAPDGRVQRTGLMVATVPLGSPIRGALRTLSRVRIAGRAEVSGFDSIPPTWSDDCPPLLTDAPGIVMTDTSKLTHSGASRVDGAPAIDENADTTGYFNFGDLTYDEVAAMADIELPDGTNISGADPAPSYTADGKCDTNTSGNWGDPENDDQPCSDWFPIIRALGDLTLSGSGAGQGILLVDGDLSLCGGATFYGAVVVKGSVKSCGSGFRLFGGVVAGESDLNPQGGGMVIGASRVQYGSCVVQRAISRSGAGVPRPLAERPWFQLR